MTRFIIVTPTFQSEPYLDACIHSIVGQSGHFDIRYHIQDGGSSDGTLAIAERWKTLLETSPEVFSSRTTLSFDSAPDTGMYDALARGFHRLQPQAGDIMAWLNSDDLLAPGALSAVAGAMAALPEIALCGGPKAMIDAQGRVVRVSRPKPIVRNLLKAGLYDGRQLPFVMQEGTFWTADLWRKVGGLDPSFRLAGDWDLWRRMAEHTDYVRLNTSTGFHRRRPGQLSTDTDAYHAELEGALDDAARQRRAEALAAYVRAGVEAGAQPVGQHDGPVAMWDRDRAAWRMTHQLLQRPSPARDVAADHQADRTRGHVLSGAAAFLGPDDEGSLAFGARWITEPVAVAVVQAARAGPSRVRLVCRPSAPDMTVLIRSEGELVFSNRLGLSAPFQDQILEFDLWTLPGENRLEIETAFEMGDREERLLLIDLTLTETRLSQAARVAAGAGRPKLAIAVVDERQPQGLARTLGSLAAQDLGDVQVGVFSVHADPRMDAALRIWPVVQTVTVAGDARERAVAFLDKSGADLRMLLRSGDALAPDAVLVLTSAAVAAPASAYEGQVVSPVWRHGDRITLAGADSKKAVFALRDDGWKAVMAAPAILDVGPAALRSALADAGAPVHAVDAPLEHRSFGGTAAPRSRAIWLRTGRDDDGLIAILERMDLDLRVLDLAPDSPDAAARLSAEISAWRPEFLLSAEPLAFAEGAIVIAEETRRAAAEALALEAAGSASTWAARRALDLPGDRAVVLAAGLEAGVVADALETCGMTEVVLITTEASGARPPSGLLPHFVAAATVVVASQTEAGLARIAKAVGTPVVIAGPGLADDLGHAFGPDARRSASLARVLTLARSSVSAVAGAVRRTIVGAAPDERLRGLEPAGKPPVAIFGWKDGQAQAPAGERFQLDVPPGSSALLVDTPLWAADRPVWLRLELGEDAQLTLSSDGASREISGGGEHLIDLAPLGVGGLRRVELDLRSVAGADAVPAAVLALADPERTGEALSGSAAWEPRDGFGAEQASAPHRGLGRPYHWILGTDARLAVLNPAAGWRRLTLRVRTEAPGQRIIVRHAGRELVEAPLTSDILSEWTDISVILNAAAGWCEFDVQLRVRGSGGSGGSALIESALLEPARPPAAGAAGAWSLATGGDFEEPPAPQYGLADPFRWCRSDCSIAVVPPKAGPARVTVIYRTAVENQVLSAILDGRVLGQGAPARGDLAHDEMMVLETDLPKHGADIALKPDRSLQSGARKLAFIIRDVRIEAAR